MEMEAEGTYLYTYKVVVEQLKRSSSKHRPNYLTFCTKSYKIFRDFFIFISFFQGEPRERMSLQPSWVDNADIFQGGGEKNSTATCTYTRICMDVIDSSRSGVLRISSEEIDKKLMYLE